MPGPVLRFCDPGVTLLAVQTEGPGMPVLTDTMCKSAKAAPGERITLADQKVAGLSLRVSATTKSWSLRYRNDESGRLERVTLGPYPSVSLARARELAEAARVSNRAGRSPREQKRAARTRAVSAATFDAIADRFITEHVERHKAPASQTQDRWLLNIARQSWSKRDPRTIDVADVFKLLEATKARGPTLSNRLRSVLSKLFAWAILNRLVDRNPVRDAPRLGRETSKDRRLDDPELTALLRALRSNTRRCEPGVALALELIVATAARPGEVSALPWSELRLEDAPTWRLPATRSKNRKPRNIPLSKWAVMLIEQARVVGSRRVGGNAFVFPSKYKGEEPIARHSLSQALVEVRQAAKIEAFTPHDLRRTAASIARERGATRDGVEALLGHTTAGVTSIYDRSQFDAEARDAVDRVAAHVSTLAYR